MSEDKMKQSFTWAGKSGASYKYYVATTTHLVGMAGNFIWVAETDDGPHAVYVGEAGDLTLAFSPAVMDAAKAAGATVLHLHNNFAAKEARHAEALDLIEMLAPVCNQPAPKA
jgi:hypothetical protein